MAVRAPTLDRRITETGRRERRHGVDLLPYLLLIPSIALIVVIILYPLATGVYYSLNEGSLLRLDGFIGLANYRNLLAMSDFRHALWFSALFAACSVAGSYLMGLGLALLLNQEIPGRAFFRVALLLPWVIPSIVSVASWRWLIADQNGLVNQALNLVGLGPIFFLSTGDWAMFSVIMIKIWRSFPFMMVSCLAALQSIDRDMYEAARIDGAGRWQSFRDITMPQIFGISVVMWILMTIWSVNDFETPWLLTQGGPSNATENLIVLAYKYTFTRNDVGIGSAIAVVSMIILMALALLLLRKQRGEE
ncbi:MAG: binding-protein-dependent transport system inner rane component [Thermomicrobiales bacterium]|jgi:ABC-type sugar transport system permease subunit|nr:binding-protein-dependent transport system inner rane component [Thermomicrobiales bacterium]